jgi:acetyl-CoA carboxylase carboxyl transferase subunit beta
MLVASHEEPEDIQVEVEREETPREQPPAQAKLHPNTCPVCKSHYREDELRAVLRVCTVCGHHFPVGAEERVEQLADPGSFRPLAEGLRSADPLAFTDLRPYTERLSEAEVATGLGDAMVAGTATVVGMPCVLCTMDFTFMGGSMGSVVGEIFTRAADVAAERGIPLISVTSSGGARMQENILALMQMAKTVCAVDLLQESGVPYVSVLAHPTTGGVIASFAALGDFVVSEPGALLSFAGPRVVQETTRETLPPDFGRAESSLEHGLIDAVVTRDDLKAELGQILRLCAGGTLVPMEPNGDAVVPPPGVVARVLRFLRQRPHGDAHTNGGPA